MKEHKYLQKLMGTDFFVSIIVDDGVLDENTVDDKYLEVLHLAQSYEVEFSRFIHDSALSYLNRHKQASVSERFFYVFEKVIELWRDTDGVFNPLVRLDLLGYDSDFETTKEFHTKLSSYNTDFSQISYDRDSLFIELKDGQCLDFGGLVKGLLAHEIALSLSDACGVVVNLGGDISTRGLNLNGERFVFNIYNPVSKQYDIHVPLHNRSLATSGEYKRRWESGDTEYSHIISADQEVIDTDLASATVIADEGYLADAYATTCMILGSSAANEFLCSRKVDFVLIKKDGVIMSSENSQIKTS